MATKFQKTVSIDDLKHVCKLMHPTLNDKQLNLLKFYLKYSWICVGFSVGGYGYISFAIDNHKQSSFYGIQPLKRFADALSNGNIKWNVWRFADDKLFHDSSGEPLSDAVVYLKSKYALPSAEELYREYHRP